MAVTIAYKNKTNDKKEGDQILLELYNTFTTYIRLVLRYFIYSYSFSICIINKIHFIYRIVKNSLLYIFSYTRNQNLSSEVINFEIHHLALEKRGFNKPFEDLNVRTRTTMVGQNTTGTSASDVNNPKTYYQSLIWMAYNLSILPNSIQTKTQSLIRSRHRSLVMKKPQIIKFYALIIAFKIWLWINFFLKFR